MKTEKIGVKETAETEAGTVSCRELLPGEIKGALLTVCSMKGPCVHRISPEAEIYDVVLTLGGEASLETGGRVGALKGEWIIRPSFGHTLKFRVEADHEFHFLLIRSRMEPPDIRLIASRLETHNQPYLKALEECPQYTEEIKSSKTVNRMILPEGMVPRFCMGSVETTGPDRVEEHDHPMLDQLFLGRKGCRCHCYAGGEYQLLEENRMLHIPLASKHHVEVEPGDLLSYIWFDFFLSLEGQNYMNEQHKMKDP